MLEAVSASWIVKDNNPIVLLNNHGNPVGTENAETAAIKECYDKRFNEDPPLTAVFKKPVTKRWNLPWNFNGYCIEFPVEFPVEFPQKVPQRQNRGTFCVNSTGNYTESKPWNFLWNFDGKLHRDKTVEFPVEFQQKVPQRQNRGNFCGISTGRCFLHWAGDATKR